MRMDNIACTAVGCNMRARIQESIGTTCDYFEYCPGCGRKRTLNVWTAEFRSGTEYQVIRRKIIPYE